MPKLMTLTIWLLTIQLSNGPLFADAINQTTTRELEDIAKRYEDIGWFSGSVHVASRDRVLLNNGYGYANQAFRIKNSPETKFLLASISKQFTATAILLLEEAGSLSVEDLVSTHVPEYRHGDKITIHDLMTHTSGIPNTDQLHDLDIRKRYTPAELFQLFREEELQFEPGSRWSYSNTGYYLLGLIIERASGMEYQDYIGSIYSQRFQLSDTQTANNEEIPSDLASFYTYSPTGNLINAEPFDFSWTFSAGDSISTTQDLYRWDRLLAKGRVLRNNGEQRLFEPHAKMSSGTHYGYGWIIDEFESHRRVWHSGGLPGVSTYFYRYPDQDSSVIILANRQCLAAAALAADLSAAILGVPYTLPVKRLARAPTREEIDAIIGLYKLTNLGIDFELEILKDPDGIKASWLKNDPIKIASESSEVWFVEWDDITLTFDFSLPVTQVAMQFGDRVAVGEKLGGNLPEH